MDCIRDASFSVRAMVPMMLLLPPLLFYSVEGFLLTSVPTQWWARPSESWLSVFPVAQCYEPKDDDDQPLIPWWNADTYIATNQNDIFTLPIYPLPAVYLPTNTTVILNNVEPRNLQMALDLAESEALFCAVARTADTNEIGRYGTVLRVEHWDKQFQNQQLQRIRVHCRPTGVVEIVDVKNPNALWNLEYRLQHPNEYLVGTVRILLPQRESFDMVEWSNDDDAVRDIVENYNAVVDMYKNGPGQRLLPKISKDTVGDSMKHISLSDVQFRFWIVLETWQQLLNAVQQHQYSLMVGERNEKLIEAALKKGGTLQLPVHSSDLAPSDQADVRQLEQDFEATWREMQLDPVLDFQVLLGADTGGQLEHFGRMVQRERRRLERLPAIVPETEPQPTNVEPQPWKGAWFEDDW